MIYTSLPHWKFLAPFLIASSPQAAQSHCPPLLPVCLYCFVNEAFKAQANSFQSYGQINASTFRDLPQYGDLLFIIDQF